MDPNISLLYPKGYTERESYRIKDTEFADTLALRSMIVLVNETFRGVPPIRLADFFTSDDRVISYRLDVLEELLANPSLIDMFERALPLIRGIYDMHSLMNGSVTIDKALSIIRILETYINITELFAEDMRGMELHSEGLSALKAYVMERADSEEYKNMKRDMDSCDMDFSELRSVTIGVNLDESLQAEEAGLLSVNTKRFRKGSLVGKVTGRDKNDPYTLLSVLYPLPKGKSSAAPAGTAEADAYADGVNFERSVRHAIEEIYRSSIKAFVPVVERYFNTNTSGYASLFSEVRFLLAEVKFIRKMRDEGFRMVRPEVHPASEKICSMKGLVSVSLALNKQHNAVIKNDFEIDENGRFFLLTGPNHGGKSVYARAVGAAMGLFLLGCFVPCSEAAISPVTGIYTHFAAADSADAGRGRFESECERLAKILRKLTSTDMLIMDESFSGTSALEAAYIAEEVITGIGAIGPTGVFVTHIHELAEKLDEFNSYPGNKAKVDNLAALMENKEKGTRSFRIVRTKPDGLSYARDIAAKCGLNFTDRGNFGTD